MDPLGRKPGVLLVALFTFSALAVAEQSRPSRSDGPALVNWPAPANSISSKRANARALNILGQEQVTDELLPFVPIAPCRQHDSRNSAPLANNTPRLVRLSGAPCGIPNSAGAVSVNITVFDINGATGNGVFKVDTASPPTTAWINYPPSETQRANAGVVPLPDDQSGKIAVQVNQGAGSVDFTIDVNGYFTAAPNTGDQFILIGNASFPLIAVQNIGSGDGIDGTAGGGGVGVRGSSGPNVGVQGASGGSYGVMGLTSSSAGEIAGVYGQDGTGPVHANVLPLSAGVRGVSLQHVGVSGLSEYVAVAGDLLSSGDIIAKGFLGSAIGTGAGSTSGPWGVFAQGDFGASGAKHFVEPHPSDASKVIVYTSIEGRTADTSFRGTARFVDHIAVIDVPEDFRTVTDESGLTVQVTPIGGPASTYVESRDLNHIVVRSSSDVEFDYLIQGVRRAFRDFQPVQTGYEFVPESADQRMPSYLTEEAKRRLIANGTYNTDGTVNLSTAERLGWTRIWADRKAAAEAASRAASAGDVAATTGARQP